MFLFGGYIKSIYIRKVNRTETKILRMKVSRKNQETKFEPIKLEILIENEKELDTLREIVKLDVSIPNLLGGGIHGVLTHELFRLLRAELRD